MATISLDSDQSGSVALTSTGQTVAISSVVTTQSIILWTASIASNDVVGVNTVAARFNSSTEIELIRGVTGTTINVEWVVIEFDSSVSVQHLTRTMTSTSHTDTITSVDLSRSIVIANGCTTTGSIYGSDDDYRVSLSSSTQILYEVGSVFTLDVFVSVVEFPANAIESIQFTTGSVSASTVNDTITSVDAAQSLIFGSSFPSGNLGIDDVYGMELTSSTNLQLSKVSSVITWDYGVFVVEFTDYDITRGSVTPSTSLTETEGLGSAPSAGSAILGTVSARPYLLGSTNTLDNVAQSSWRAGLSGSTWTFTRESSANNSDLFYSIIDWGQTVTPSGNDGAAVYHYMRMMGVYS